jgi:hypothetical protein
VPRTGIPFELCLDQMIGVLYFRVLVRQSHLTLEALRSSALPMASSLL